MLHLDHFGGRLVDESFDHVLVAQPIGPGDRVIGMLVQAVIGFNNRGSATLRGDRVAAHRVNFRNNGNAKLRVRLAQLNRGPQSRSPAADDQNIMFVAVHPVDLLAPNFSMTSAQKMVRKLSQEEGKAFSV